MKLKKNHHWKTPDSIIKATSVTVHWLTSALLRSQEVQGDDSRPQRYICRLERLDWTPSRPLDPHTVDKRAAPLWCRMSGQPAAQPDLLWTAAYRHTNASLLFVLQPEHIQAGGLKVIVNVRPCQIIDHRGDSRPDKIITSEHLAAQPLPVTAEVVVLFAPHVDQFQPANVVYWLSRKLDVINHFF